MPGVLAQAVAELMTRVPVRCICRFASRAAGDSLTRPGTANICIPGHRRPIRRRSLAASAGEVGTSSGGSGGRAPMSSSRRVGELPRCQTR